MTQALALGLCQRVPHRARAEAPGWRLAPSCSRWQALLLLL